MLHVDYAASLADASGVLRDAYTTDGVHLTRRAYRAMRSRAERVIQLAVRNRA